MIWTRPLDARIPETTLQPPAAARPSAIAPDWSFRAVATGFALAGLLAVCNLYSGLKIGWSSNMSVTGALLSWGVWRARPASARERSEFTMSETCLAQTTCSAGAAVSSAGLVAGIPALTLLTGQVLPWWQLAMWTLSVMLVGIVVAIPLRRYMLVQEPLPFPYGVATAETLKQMYSRGHEAMARVRILAGSAFVAGVVKVLEQVKILKLVALPGSAKGSSLFSLTWAFDPSLLLVGAGGLMGLRSALSLFAGSIIAFLILGPELISSGTVAPGAPGKPWFKEIVGWVLWPGVTLMVVASLAGFAMAWRSVIRAFSGLAGASAGANATASAPAAPQSEAHAMAEANDVPHSWFLKGVVATLVISVVLQIALFSIPIWLAVLSVVLAFALAIVAARVNGETGVTPIGAMGKVTQFVAGATIPGDAAANLMTANVTGGAASQCGDLMNDLKTGQMVGVSPKSLVVAQVIGVLAGAMVGSAIYLVLIPDPKSQLFTAQWAAPAVATWKAVAEVFSVGLSALPKGTPTAMAIGAVVAIVLAILETKSPAHIKRFVPNPAAMGLGFVIPAYQSTSMLLGGVLAVIVGRVFPSWSGRFWVVACAGVIVGESLVGVGVSLKQILN